MQFAKETTVSVEKSKAEIESVVMRYKGSAFGSFWDQGRAAVIFEMNNRRLRFILPLPAMADKVFNVYKRGYSEYKRSPQAAYAAWEQACRQRWRALLLTIRAKLESVECGIESFDEAFLSNIVMADGRTIGEMAVPQLQVVISSSKLPPLLSGPPQQGN